MGCKRCKRLNMVCFMDRWSDVTKNTIPGKYPMPSINTDGYAIKKQFTIRRE